MRQNLLNLAFDVKLATFDLLDDFLDPDRSADSLRNQPGQRGIARDRFQATSISAAAQTTVSDAAKMSEFTRQSTVSCQNSPARHDSHTQSGADVQHHEVIETPRRVTLSITVVMLCEAE